MSSALFFSTCLYECATPHTLQVVGMGVMCAFVCLCLCERVKNYTTRNRKQKRNHKYQKLLLLGIVRNLTPLKTHELLYFILLGFSVFDLFVT